MNNIKLNAIVTRYTDYRESDRILTLFSREAGRADVKAQGSRRPKSRLFAAAQPFVYGEFLIYKSQGKYALDSCETHESFYPIREDYGKFAAGSAMLSLCNEAIREDEPNEPLFSLLYHSLSFLAYGDSDARDMLICFLIRYLDALGFRPSVTACARCGADLRSEKQLAFSPEAGGALCPSCSAGAPPVSALSLEAMRRMLLLGDSELNKARLPEKVREQLWTSLSACVRFVLDEPLKILSNLNEALRYGGQP
jgi:DNA repair protein RecO (recombination protein O)